MQFDQQNWFNASIIFFFSSSLFLILRQKQFLKAQVFFQRCSRGQKARGQGQAHKKNPSPRPRTAFTRTDPLKDRNARGLGYRRKRSPEKKFFKDFFWRFPKKTKTDVLKKFLQAKKVLKIFFFRQSSIRENKKDLCKLSARFLAFSNKISTAQKIVLFSSRGQRNFRGLEPLGPRT